MTCNNFVGNLIWSPEIRKDSTEHWKHCLLAAKRGAEHRQKVCTEFNASTELNTIPKQFQKIKPPRFGSSI